MPTRVIQTSPSGARHVGRTVGRTVAVDLAAAAVVDLAAAAVVAASADPARCIQRFARSVGRTLRCPSDPEATDPSTAATATASSATGAARAQVAVADLHSAIKPSKLSAV